MEYTKVLSEDAIDNLYRMCEVDKEDKRWRFLKISDFATKYAIIKWGARIDTFDENKTGIINSSGKFVEIHLDKNFIYRDGQILQLKPEEPAFCEFWFYEIPVKSDLTYLNLTGFFVCEIKITPKKITSKVGMNYWYVLDPNLKVIASFEDKHYNVVKYGGFYCNSYKTMDFWFPFPDYNFLAFEKRNMIWSEEDEFFNEIGYQENEEWLYEEFDEWQIEEYKLKQMKFYDSLQNKDFKYYLEKPFRRLYGIIDCKIHPKKQLIPFTPSKEYAESIIGTRIHKQNNPFEDKMGWYPNWSGYILSNKFIPCGRLKGLTLKYAAKYYPDTLLEYVENCILLIPTTFLKSIGKNKLYIKIGILQDSRLQFKEINSKNQILESNIFYGVVSIFQGKTLKQVLSAKGGTEYLVHMIEQGVLEIDETLLYEMLSNNNDKTEVNSINILIDTKNEIEEEIRAAEEEQWRRDMEKYWEEETRAIYNEQNDAYWDDRYNNQNDYDDYDERDYDRYRW